MLGPYSSKLTDSARRILQQVKDRANDRGLRVIDKSAVVLLAVWSLLLWERKVGRVALERIGVDPFEFARGVDELLTTKALEHPVVYNQRQGTLVFAKTGEPYHSPDFRKALEPLLKEAATEAQSLGHNYIGSEHLLLAIVQLADRSLDALLQERGVRYPVVREAVIELLDG